MSKIGRAWSIVGAVLICANVAGAGGGPENVLVLYNAHPSARHPGALNDSPEIAEYYRALRGIPRDHMLPIFGLEEARTTPLPQTHTITLTQYKRRILLPLGEKLLSLRYPEEIDYLVLIRGLPYRVDLESSVSAPNDCASLTSMLGVYRAYRASDPSDELWDDPHPISDFLPYRRPSTANPLCYAGNYQGDYQDPTASHLKYLTSTGIARRTLAEGQVPSFRRLGTVPVPDPPNDWVFGGNLFLVSWLDGFSYGDAKNLADLGVLGDGALIDACGSNPCSSTSGAPDLLCMKGRNLERQARDEECRFALELLEGAGFCTEYVRDPLTGLAVHDRNLANRSMAAYFTGSDKLQTHFVKDGDALSGNCFAPGAIFCNLTSNAGNPPNFYCNADGYCPPFNDQTLKSGEVQSSVARVVQKGITGAHATVAEPFSHAFPGAGTMLLYTFGYNFAESFFFTQPYVHWQNTYLGDPLTTAYAVRPIVSHPQAVPRSSPLPVTASHDQGIARIRVYVDGVRRADAENPSCSSPFTVAVPTAGLLVGPHEIVAVAYACNLVVARPGWPEPLQFPQPDVQGWSSGTFSVVRP
jgi:hypothetical protein